MTDEHVISGLMRKRAELAGKIDAMQTEVRQLLIDLDAVDSTLRLYVPDIELAIIKPKPLPPKHHAFRGELTSILLPTLRRFPDGLTSLELAKHVMVQRELDTADAQLVRMMAKRVGAALRNQRRHGVVRTVRRADSANLWLLV
jgi:hypothetical protein